MTGVDFGLAGGMTAIAGLLVYLAACAYHRVVPPIEKLVEALGFGGLIAVGLHVIYGAFDASQLCAIVDATGKAVEGSGYHLNFGDHTYPGKVLVFLAWFLYPNRIQLSPLWIRSERLA